MIAPFLASFSVNLFKHENKRQFIFSKDPNSIKMNDIPVILFSKMLTSRDSNKSCVLDGDLLKALTNNDFNVGHSNPQDQKVIYEFGNEMKFDIKQKRQKNNREISFIKLPKSPAMMDSEISTKF